MQTNAIHVDPIVITARLEAIEGRMAWRMPIPETPSLLDVVTQGYAAICYDGNRAPRTARCVGCGKQTTHAWRVHPINFTVPACTGDCVADKVQNLWATDHGLVCIRIRGDKALHMAFGDGVAA